MYLIKKRLTYVGYIILASAILLEIVLRIYNPIPVRIKGDKIVLPANQHMTFQNEFSCFDKVIHHSKNELGFRGSSLPQHPEDFIKLITVGGSTTECFFVSDDKVWSKVLEDSLQKYLGNVWVNNAGLNGHSTFGHKILMEDIVAPLKPDYVLFLIGVNDIDRSDLGDFDKKNLKGFQNASANSTAKNFLLFLANNTELGNLLFNISKSLKARNQKIFIDKVLRLNPSDTLHLSETYMQHHLQQQKEYLPAYKTRIALLDSISKANNIIPIFITQPLLFGEGIDPVTGTNLALYHSSEGMNGLLFWKKLELYNEELRNYCQENERICVDLANLLPKSSEYFYDEMHFSNAGSIKVGQLLNQELTNKILNTK